LLSDGAAVARPCLRATSSSQPPYLRRQLANAMQRGTSAAATVAAAMSQTKPWRLSASVVVAVSSEALPARTVLDGGVAAAADSCADYRVCLVQRTAKSSFMPSVSVFPGGAVDAADRRAAAAAGGTGTSMAPCLPPPAPLSTRPVVIPVMRGIRGR
jgi:hypothetical protein